MTEACNDAPMKFTVQILCAAILGALVILGLTARYLPPHDVLARFEALTDPEKILWTADSVANYFQPASSLAAIRPSDLIVIPIF